MIPGFGEAENKLFYCGVRQFIDSRADVPEDDPFDTGVAFFDAMPYQNKMAAILQLAVQVRTKWKDQHIAAFLAIAHVISDEIEVECDDADSEIADKWGTADSVYYSQYWRDLVWAYALTQGYEGREQTRERWVELVHDWMVEVVGTAHDDPYYLQTSEAQVLNMCERYVDAESPNEHPNERIES